MPGARERGGQTEECLWAGRARFTNELPPPAVAGYSLASEGER
jgi:hypothetical protein